MASQLRWMVPLCLIASACAGDDGEQPTTAADASTAGTAATAATAGTVDAGDTMNVDTSTGDGSADASSGDDTGAMTGGASSSGSSGSEGVESGSGSESSGTTGAAQTECGGEFCDTATQICVERAKGGPSILGCEPVPQGCRADRTCNCVGVPLCTVGIMQCTDVAENQVFCDSGLD